MALTDMLKRGPGQGVGRDLSQMGDFRRPQGMNRRVGFRKRALGGVATGLKAMSTPTAGGGRQAGGEEPKAAVIVKTALNTVGAILRGIEDYKKAKVAEAFAMEKWKMEKDENARKVAADNAKLAEQIRASIMQQYKDNKAVFDGTDKTDLPAEVKSMQDILRGAIPGSAGESLAATLDMVEEAIGGGKGDKGEDNAIELMGKIKEESDLDAMPKPGVQGSLADSLGKQPRVPTAGQDMNQVPQNIEMNKFPLPKARPQGRVPGIETRQEQEAAAGGEAKAKEIGRREGGAQDKWEWMRDAVKKGNPEWDDYDVAKEMTKLGRDPAIDQLIKLLSIDIKRSGEARAAGAYKGKGYKEAKTFLKPFLEKGAYPSEQEVTDWNAAHPGTEIVLPEWGIIKEVASKIPIAGKKFFGKPTPGIKQDGALPEVEGAVKKPKSGTRYSSPTDAPCVKGMQLRDEATGKTMNCVDGKWQ